MSNIKQNGVLLPASFENLSLLKDRSVTLKFSTRELSGDEITDLLGFRFAEGWLQFNLNKEFVAPPTENAHLDTKSPSERLRDVLFVYYKQKEVNETFDTFYATNIEKFISHVKTKLEK